LDGLGLADMGGGAFRLLVHHEIFVTEGAPAPPLPSGARISAVDLRVAPDASPIVDAASLGIRVVYDVSQFDVVEGDHYRVVTSPHAVGQLCSATLAGPADGFDTAIFLGGEEARSPNSFDGQGGLAFALLESGDYFTLRRGGHMQHENVVPVRGLTAPLTALVLPDDGPGLDGELYLYVGAKIAGSPDVLARNGLSTGSLYVWASDPSGVDSEVTFATKGATLFGHWRPVSWSASGASLHSSAVAQGAFAFDRLEDVVSDVVEPGVLYFCTTGGSSANPYGRVYRLTIDPANPAGGLSSIQVLLDGSEGIVSPDNLGLNAHGELMIQEDPTYDLEQDLGLDRDSSIWMYDLADASLERIAEVDRASATAHALAADPDNFVDPASDIAGGWETTGIIDGEAHFGRGAWFVAVQAHSLQIDPDAETVAGGQLLFLRHLPSSSVGVGDALPSSPERLRLVAAPNPTARGAMLVIEGLGDTAGAGHVEITILDASGRRVCSATTETKLFAWDGKDSAGRDVAAGIYLVRARRGSEEAATRVSIVR